MHPPVSAARWAAIRALREGKAPTFPRLAAAANLHVTTIRERASRDEWIKQHFPRKPGDASNVVAFPAPRSSLPAGEGGPDVEPAGWREMSPADRLHWLNAFVSRQVAEIAMSAEAQGGALDKARLDAVWSMIRMVERSGTLVQEWAADKETGSDAELSARLRQLDDRVVELAQAHAEWLVGEHARQGAG